MASKAQTNSKAKPASRNRDLAYRSSQDVNGPLAVILAMIAFVLLASFVYSLDWHYSSDLPAVTQTLPPAAPLSTPPANS
jgi:hypothetical protein